MPKQRKSPERQHRSIGKREERIRRNPYELQNILKYWIRSKNDDLKVIPTDSIVMKVDKGSRTPQRNDDTIDSIP